MAFGGGLLVDRFAREGRSAIVKKVYLLGRNLGIAGKVLGGLFGGVFRVLGQE